MANKTLKKKVQAKPAISKFTEPMVDTVYDIWCAGLGVFSVAQQEGGKLIDQGNRFFDMLVSEGTRLEKKTLGVAETAVDDLKDEVESQIDVARQQIADNFGGIGHIFDERVLGTLDRLGIPTSKELNKLSGRVQKMSSQAIKNLKDLENAFEDRVSTALKNLDVPKVEDLNKLSESLRKVSSDAVTNLGNLYENVQKVSSEATANFDGLTENVQKLSSDTTAKLVKLEKELGTHVSGAISKFETATAKEIESLRTGMNEVAGNVTENWDKLESVVEGRVKDTLGGLGIPSADDISKLSLEVQKLSRQVAAMEKNLQAAAKPAVRKAPVKKAAASKKPAPKKAEVKK